MMGHDRDFDQVESIEDRNKRVMIGLVRKVDRVCLFDRVCSLGT